MFYRFLVIVAIMCLSSGCVSTRSLGEISQIKAEQRVTLIEKAKHVGIYKVDDNHRGYGFVERFQIAPGTHTITFQGFTKGYAVTTYVEMKRAYNFAPGRTYVIQDMPTAGPFAVWIMDEATGVELSPL